MLTPNDKKIRNLPAFRGAGKERGHIGEKSPVWPFFCVKRREFPALSVPIDNRRPVLGRLGRSVGLFTS